MGLVRFELTIDGSLRKCQDFGNLIFEQHVQCSNGSSLLTASGSLGRPVAHHYTPELIPGSLNPGSLRFSAGARRHAGLGHSPLWVANNLADCY